MTDTLNCFTYLHENIPKWNENLSTLHGKMSEKMPNNEVVQVKAKNPSAESIRLDVEAPATQHPSIDPIVPSSSVPLQSDAATPATPSPNPAKRKRTTQSLLSGPANGRYRTRHMVVVYYDSGLQKAFEDLVREIGVSRNQIRKGRNAARLEAMINLSANLDADDDTSLPVSKMGPKMGGLGGLGGFRSTRAMGLGRSASGQNNPTNRLFDEMDGILEKAQNLCERAAHQILRDGNALAEIDRTKGQFEELYKLCDKELARRKEEAEKQKQMEDTQQENGPAGQMEIEPSHTEPTPVHSTSTQPAPIQPSKSMMPSVGIEVDDDEDSDAEPITLPPMRLTSRMASRA